jgi:hypothetical protein
VRQCESLPVEEAWLPKFSSPNLVVSVAAILLNPFAIPLFVFLPLSIAIF